MISTEKYFIMSSDHGDRVENIKILSLFNVIVQPIMRALAWSTETSILSTCISAIMEVLIYSNKTYIYCTVVLYAVNENMTPCYFVACR